MSWLSPVQWAKWTWSAVTGAPGDEGPSKDDISDSEGNFETPEAESPSVLKHLTQQNISGEAGRPLNDLSSRPAPGSGGYALDHNLNLTQGPRPGAAPRPPSLPLPSPHTRPDPSEVDDEAPPAPPRPHQPGLQHAPPRLPRRRRPRRHQREPAAQLDLRPRGQGALRPEDRRCREHELL
ncbi:unnamed protein product [Gadus morhua 'NCC']